jgi:hypothetical protein
MHRAKSKRQQQQQQHRQTHGLHRTQDEKQTVAKWLRVYMTETNTQSQSSFSGAMRRVLLAVVLAAACASVQAAITSPEPYQLLYTDADTGVTALRNARRLPYTCGSNEPHVSAQVGNTWVLVKCDNPRALSTTPPFMMLPRDVVLAAASVKTALNPASAAYGSTYANTTIIGSSAARRRLLMSVVNPSRKLLWDPFSYIRNSIIRPASCAIGFSNQDSCDGKTTGGDNDAQIKYVNATINMLRQQLNFTDKLLQLENTEYALNQAMVTTVNATIAYAQAVYLGLNTTNNNLEALGRDVVDLRINTQQLKDNINTALISGLSESTSYTDSQVSNLQARLLDNDRSILTYVANSTDNVLQRVAALGSRVDQLLELVQAVETSALFGPGGLNEIVDDASKLKLWQEIAIQQDLGYTLFVDPDHAGAPPATSITPAQLTGVLDDYLINTVNGTNVAHQYNVVYNFNKATIYKKIALSGSWRQLYNLVGPLGCSRNCTLGDGNYPVSAGCNAWISITHSTCTVASSFQWESITGSDRSQFVLNAAKCLGVAPTKGAWNNRILTDMEQFRVFLSQITSAPLQSNNPRFQSFSLRQKTPTIMRFFTDPKVQAVDLPYIYGGSVQTEPSLPFMVFSLWQIAVPVISTEWQIYKNQLVGIRPDGTTTEVHELQTLSNGESVKEYVTGVSLTSTDTVIAYRVRPGLHRPAVTIETWDSPPQCDSVGYCTGTGALVDTTYTSSVDSYDIPALSDFLGPEDVIFGELSSSMTEMYDHARKDAGYGSSRSRANTHNYLGWDLPVGWNSSSTNPGVLTLSEWREENGYDTFVHFAALPLADTRRTIASSKCRAADGLVDGHMCRFKAAFGIDDTSRMRTKGNLVTYPFVYSYTGTVSVVEGPVVVRVNDGCPEVAFDSVAGSVVASITNSLWTYLSIIIRTRTLDDSCPAYPDQSIVLSPKQVYTIDVPTCMNTSFEILRDNAGTITSCGDPITTTVGYDSKSIGSVASFVNNITAVYVQNSVNSYTAAASLLFVGFMDAVAYYSNPVVPPELQDLSIYERDAQRNLTLATYRAQLAALSATTNFTDNLDSISNLGQALRDLYNTTILKALQAAQGGFVNLTVALAAQGAALSNLQQATAGYDAATRVTIAAGEVYMAELLAQKQYATNWLIGILVVVGVLLVCGCCAYYAMKPSGGGLVRLGGKIKTKPKTKTRTKGKGGKYVNANEDHVVSM